MGRIGRKCITSAGSITWGSIMKIGPVHRAVNDAEITIFISDYQDLETGWRCGKELGLGLLPFC